MAIISHCLLFCALGLLVHPAIAHASHNHFIPQPTIKTINGSIHVNSSTGDQVFLNGIDVLASLTQLEIKNSQLEAALNASTAQFIASTTQLTALVQNQSAIIANLSRDRLTHAERLRILELTDSPTSAPTSAAPTSAAPTRAPTAAPTDPAGSVNNPGRSCYTLYQSGIRASGNYYINRLGTGRAIRVSCDMSSGGGFDVLNSQRQANVPGRHAAATSTWTVADFGYPAASFNFGVVQARYQFAGELDDSNNYVRSYFNGRQISYWRNGRCNSNPVTPSGWPVTATVSSNSFSIRSQPSGDVDVTCGSIPRYGRNYYTIIKAQFIPR